MEGYCEVLQIMHMTSLGGEEPMLRSTFHMSIDVQIDSSKLRGKHFKTASVRCSLEDAVEVSEHASAAPLLKSKEHRFHSSHHVCILSGDCAALAGRESNDKCHARKSRLLADHVEHCEAA